MTIVDVQFVPPKFDWPELLEWTLEAEASGYSAVWVLDHFSGRPIGGEDVFECFAWLGALAASTSRIALGSLVTNVWNRNLGPTVVAASTVASISARPFFFGVGAGASPTSRFASEHNRTNAYIAPQLSVRHQRVIDVLEFAREAWTLPADGFLIPSIKPRTVVGVNTERLAQIAVVHADGINFWWHHPKREKLLDIGRREQSKRAFDVTAWTAWEPGLENVDHPQRQAMEGAGLTRIILSATDRLPPLS